MADVTEAEDQWAEIARTAELVGEADPAAVWFQLARLADRHHRSLDELVGRYVSAVDELRADVAHLVRAGRRPPVRDPAAFVCGMVRRRLAWHRGWQRTDLDDQVAAQPENPPLAYQATSTTEQRWASIMERARALDASMGLGQERRAEPPPRHVIPPDELADIEAAMVRRRTIDWVAIRARAHAEREAALQAHDVEPAGPPAGRPTYGELLERIRAERRVGRGQ